MKEQDTVRAILAYLGARGVLAWRNNVGAVSAGGRFVRFGSKGMSDIIGVLPPRLETNNRNFGRFLAIEVKRPGQQPTPYQAGFLDQVRKAGGVAFVATSVQDVERELYL